MDVVSIILSGLFTSSVLFLVASGLTLIFGVSRFLNLAHGSVVMLGAFLAYQFSSWVTGSLGYWLGLIAIPLFVAGISVILEILVLRPSYRADVMGQALITVALIFIFADGMRMIWGTQHKNVSVPTELTGRLEIAGTSILVYNVLVIAVGLFVAVLLWYVLQRSHWGRLVRACAEDREMANVLGINERAIMTSVFAAASALAGLAGALVAPLTTAHLGMDLQYLVLALVVVVVGGMGSLTGSVIAALIIGLSRAFGTIIIPQFEILFIAGIMVLVLIVRPHGLLGHRLEARG